MIPWLSLFLGASVGAGVNAYLTLLAVGLYARLGEASPQIQEAIDPFGSLWVIVPAGAMFLVEFLADKVPALDNLWDALHTVIRPVAAVLIALTLARDLDTAMQIFAALGGGTVALGAHGLKAGVRGLARLNPEPATNALSSTGLSLLEDVSVAGMLALVFAAPAVAFVLLVALLVVMALVGPRLLRVARFAFRASVGRLLAPFVSGRHRAGEVHTPPPSIAAALRRRDPPIDARWWGRCFIDLGGLFDLRPAVVVVSDAGLCTIHRSWGRMRVRVLPTASLRGSGLVRGPLAARLDLGEGAVRLVFTGADRSVLDALLERLEAADVAVADEGPRRGRAASGRPAPAA